MKNGRIRNIIAAALNLLNFLLIAFCVCTFFVRIGDGNMQVAGFGAFMYFTVDSNVLSALGSLFAFYYSLKAIRSGVYNAPRCVALFRFVGAASVAVTFFTVLFFLGSLYGYAVMYEKNNLWWHLICPLLSMFSFAFFESGRKIKPAASVLSVIPTAVYGAVYLTMVLLVGEKNGGWADFYGFNIGGRWYISLFGMLAGTYLLGLALLSLRNLFSRKNEKEKDASPKILVTAFEPFGKDDYNPTGSMIGLLEGNIIKAVLPTEYDGAAKKLLALIGEVHPDAVICTGVAGGRSEICIEKLAKNVRSASLADNAGVTASGEPVINGGEPYLETLFDTVAMAQSVAEKNIPCRVSSDAGTFVCNSTYYTLLSSGYPGLFIHIPYDKRAIKEKPAEAPFLELESSAAAVQTVIDFVTFPLCDKYRERAERRESSEEPI